MVLYFGIGGGILVAKLHTDTGRAVTLSPFGGNPDDGARDGYLLWLIHQGKQHEDFVTNLVDLVGGYE